MSPPRSKTPARKKAPKTKARAKAGKAVLLSGGNPQIAKADGDAPVQAFIAAAPGWKSAAAARVDALIVKALPKVRKAVKWNSPLYGMDGRSWFLSVHVYANYLKLAFFRGIDLEPPLPVGSKDPNTRYLHIPEEGFDEAQFVRWVKQAAKLPGWVP